MSPLKRAGSKSSIGRDMVALSPLDWKEYREPFCGSASMLDFVPTNIPRWINDKDWRVVRFLTWLRDDETAVDEIMGLTSRLTDATAAYHAFCDAKYGFYKGEPLAVLLISRLSYLQQYSLRRSNIASLGYSYLSRLDHLLTRENVQAFRERLQGVKITCGDYSELLNAPGDGVWIYLDPPWSQVEYDHTFSLADHVRLRDRLLACRHKWLMSLGTKFESLYAGRQEFIVRWRKHKRLRQLGCHASSLSPRCELVIRNYQFSSEDLHEQVA